MGNDIDDLNECVAGIKRGLQEMRDAMAMKREGLCGLYDHNLWMLTHETWGEFCEEMFGISEDDAYRIMYPNAIRGQSRNN